MSTNMFNSMQNDAREDVVNSKSGVNPERSVFPYGCGKIMTMNEGYLIPVDCFFTLPGDSIDIDWTAFLESLNPFVDRMYSGMKLSIHAYYNKCEHEWKGWKNYSTRGRRGNSSISLPYVHIASQGCELLINGRRIFQTTGGGHMQVLFGGPFSLSSFLTGITTFHIANQPISISFKSEDVALATAFGMGANTQVNRSFALSGESKTYLTDGKDFNAIPFAMYQRIYRDFYLNQNLVKDNDLWFPDDEDDFCLPYASNGPVYSVGVNTNNLNFFQLVPNNYKNHIGVFQPDTTTADAPVLGALRCRQWSGDVFTTSVPFLDRNGVVNIIQAIKNTYLSSISAFRDTINTLPDIGLSSSYASYETVSKIGYPNDTSKFSQAIFQDSNEVNYQLISLLNFNEIQELAAAHLWSRRNAEAKGDYNSLIKAHYGLNPNSEDRSPRYLGGSVQRLEFNSVLSSVETANSPLGTKASIASSGGRGSITHFECPDFGYVMIIASLIPDTYYTQGLRPEFDPSLRGSELPWPEFANLQKENVLSKRLFYSGTSATDERLLAFNERFLDYKYRDNRLCAHFADYLDTKFSSMSFGRFFTATDIANMQSIDNEFVTLSPYNVRSDMYSVPSEPHFVLQFGDNVRLVRCLPYASKEAQLTNIA